MITANTLERNLASIRSQVWAIVYAYDPPAKPRSLWYDRWRYDVINDFVEAVSFLGAEPFIVDVDSFLISQKLSAGEISVAINLNSGATPISNLGVVPSVAEWHRIPCFPNSADVVLSGERKDICKKFFASWFNVPRDIDLEEARHQSDRIIVKPKTMGNSQQVTRVLPSGNFDTRAEEKRLLRNIIVEEFIEGYEVTVPVLFDAIVDDYVVLPPIVYIPNVPEPEKWYLSHESKMSRPIELERRIGRLSPEAAQALTVSSRAFNFGTLARFDFRWKTNSPNSEAIDLEKLWFLEINCLPTLRKDVNFLKSMKEHMGIQSDFLTDQVRHAKNPDIAALAYLLLQFHLRAFTTK